MQHEITLFKDIHNTSTPFYYSVSEVLDRIKDGKSKELIESIRILSEEDKEQRNELKKRLPAICFSGKFTKRADNAIQEHSGLICLDFDDFKCPTPEFK